MELVMMKKGDKLRISYNRVQIERFNHAGELHLLGSSLKANEYAYHKYEKTQLGGTFEMLSRVHPFNLTPELGYYGVEETEKYRAKYHDALDCWYNFKRSSSHGMGDKIFALRESVNFETTGIIWMHPINDSNLTARKEGLEAVIESVPATEKILADRIFSNREAFDELSKVIYKGSDFEFSLLKLLLLDLTNLKESGKFFIKTDELTAEDLHQIVAGNVELQLLVKCTKSGAILKKPHEIFKLI